MSTLAEMGHTADQRWARERAYWDDLYRPGGAGHARFLWSERLQGHSYAAGYFEKLLKDVCWQKVLSIGGGVDRVGVFLAKAGNRVLSVDLSPIAVEQTRALADRAGAAGNLTALAANCEGVELPPGEFDLVVCKRALHCMDFGKIIALVHRVLHPGGVFIAEEPASLLRLLRWLHDKLPFHPDSPCSPDEKELTETDLALVRKTFASVRFMYFDFLARESTAYLLLKLRLIKLLRPLGRVDALLVNNLFPLLKYLSTYVILRAVK
jgi:SAM-dependent methyltransferase